MAASWAFEDFDEGGTIDLGLEDCHRRGDRRIRRRIRPPADASRRGGRQGKHPRRPLGIRLAHLRHLHAPVLRRLPAGFHVAGRRPASTTSNGRSRCWPATACPPGQPCCASGCRGRARRSASSPCAPRCSTSAAKASSNWRTPVMFLTSASSRAGMSLDEFFGSASPSRSARTRFERRGDQGLRQEIRSAAVSSRRGGGEEERLRRALRLRLAHRGDLDEVQHRDRRGRPAPGRGSGPRPNSAPRPASEPEMAEARLCRRNRDLFAAQCFAIARSPRGRAGAC